jgi:4-hydroxy-3-polyprenylbenzoate decarboxylase
MAAMSHFSLTDLVEELHQSGQLVRITAGVDPVLEAAEITRRTARTGGAALLFGAVKGHSIPLVANLLGTEARVCRALGVDSLDELSERVAAPLEAAGPEGWLGRMGLSPTSGDSGRLSPKVVKTGACQQVVKLGGDVDLGELPALQSCPEETGRTITAGELFAIEAETGRVSVGRYDLPVLDRNRLAVAWHPHDDPARWFVAYRDRGGRMPLAVVLGGDPAGLLAAMAPLPEGADAHAAAALLRGKARELVKCRTVELHVPADAEIVLEGYVDPAGPPVETGPLGTSGGYYRPSRPAPVMHVTAVTHRANPIYPATVPGPPPDEVCVIQRALQRIFLPLIKPAIPELADYDLPAFGAARHWAFLSIRKTYAGQTRKVACAAWGLRPLMFAKMLVIVDEEIDVHEPQQVLSAIAAHVDPGRDVFFAEGPPDPLDPAATGDGLSHKMAVDATAKLPGEYRGQRPGPASTTEEIRRLVSRRWGEYGLGPANR